MAGACWRRACWWRACWRGACCCWRRACCCWRGARDVEDRVCHTRHHHNAPQESTRRGWAGDLRLQGGLRNIRRVGLDLDGDFDRGGRDGHRDIGHIDAQLARDVLRDRRLLRVRVVRHGALSDELELHGARARAGNWDGWRRRRSCAILVERRDLKEVQGQQDAGQDGADGEEGEPDAQRLARARPVRLVRNGLGGRWGDLVRPRHGRRRVRWVGGDFLQRVVVLRKAVTESFLQRFSPLPNTLIHGSLLEYKKGICISYHGVHTTTTHPRLI